MRLQEINIEYKVKIMHLIIWLVIGFTSVFIAIYLIAAPFMPAIVILVLYILFNLMLLIALKWRHYLFVKLGILLSYMIQLTLAVFIWFPVGTNYYLFYFLVPIAALTIMDINKHSEMVMSIVIATSAIILMILSQSLSMDFYLYELSSDAKQIISLMSVLSTILPATFIFYQYVYNLNIKQQELQKLANTDALTQITNRRVLFEHGEEEIRLAKKYHYDFTLIQLDIDFFKQINDTYGHHVGDQVLIELTNLLRSHIRKEDTFSRHGGEEFAIITRRTDKHAGQHMAEHLRAVVQEHIFHADPNAIKMTISMGLAIYSRGNYNSFNEMMVASDQALYSAKAEGRNCVKLYEPL